MPLETPELSEGIHTNICRDGQRRNDVHSDEAESAKAQPLVTRERLKGEEYSAATYFVQQLRRDLENKIGEAAFRKMV